MRADEVIGAAHDDAHGLAADEQHQRQEPLFLEAQGDIRNGEANRASDYRRDQQGQAEVDETGDRLARHDFGAQLERAAHGWSAGVDRFKSCQRWQQAGIGDAGGVSADRDEKRLAEVRQARDAVFQIEADRHQ